MAQSNVVVVGLDGSPDARAALEFAVTEAKLRNAHLKVVTAYSFPEYSALGQPYPVLVAPEQIEADVIAAIRPIVDEVLADQENPPSVQIVVRAGDAAEVLTEIASGADALVVGHRGRGGIASAVLGSVGLRCVLHARCPVTVVGSSLQREPVRASAPAAAPARHAAPATS